MTEETSDADLWPPHTYTCPSTNTCTCMWKCLCIQGRYTQRRKYKTIYCNDCSKRSQLADGFYCSRVKTITIINSSILFTSFHEILLAFKSFKAGLLFPVVTTSMPGPEISSSQCPLTVLKHAYVSFLLTLIQAVSKLILSNKTAHLTDLTLRCWSIAIICTHWFSFIG